MTYTHLRPNELVIIEAYFHPETSVAIVSKKLKRGRQVIYNVYHFLKQEKMALEYLEQYKKNKKRCGRKPIEVPKEEVEINCVLIFYFKSQIKRVVRVARTMGTEFLILELKMTMKTTKSRFFRTDNGTKMSNLS